MKDLRFPDVDRILPGPRDAATRLSLEPDDARFLLESLARMPGAGEPNSPATLDLNGRVAVRARAADREGVTELVLARSAYTGPPIRLQTNREILARAIRLGFAEVEVIDADTPLVCRDDHRVLAWQPLSKDSAIEPADDATCIESGSRVPGPPIPPPGRAAEERGSTMHRANHHRPPERVGETNGHVPAAGPGARAADRPGLVDPGSRSPP